MSENKKIKRPKGSVSGQQQTYQYPPGTIPYNGGPVAQNLAGLSLGQFKLGKIDQETLKTILMLAWIRNSKCGGCGGYHGGGGGSPHVIVVPGAGGYGAPPMYPYPYPPMGGYGQGGFGPSQADEVKEYIYNQTIDYRNAYEQNMHYISNEFQQIKDLIMRKNNG